MPLSCRAFGLHIQSDFPLPGTQPGSQDQLPDLHITHAKIKPHPPGRHLGPYTLHPDGTLDFTMSSGLMRCRIDPSGTHITVDPAPGALPEDVSAILCATAIPAALWLRGTLLIHAAAVVLPDSSRAVAIAGPSGSGKSTLLHALLRQGARVLTDDVLAVSSTFQATGLPASIQQRDPAPPPSSTQLEPRTYLPVPPTSQCSSAPLAAILILNGTPTSTRLHGPAALQALLRNLHRPRVPELLGRTPALFPQLAHLAAHIPIYSWHPTPDHNLTAALHALD